MDAVRFFRRRPDSPTLLTVQWRNFDGTLSDPVRLGRRESMTVHQDGGLLVRIARNGDGLTITPLCVMASISKRDAWTLAGHMERESA